MEFATIIQASAADPQKLEELYQAARGEGEAVAFRAAVESAHDAAPDNLLYAAWVQRFRFAPPDAAKPRRAVNWLAAIPLSILTGLIFWAISDVDNFVAFGTVPQFILWWSPIATLSALIFLAVSTRQHTTRLIALALGVLAAGGYALLLGSAYGDSWKTEQYVILAAIHLPVLCWIALGVATLGLKSSTADRFAFLIKSIEVGVVAGLYLAAGMAFGGLTLGLFAALGIVMPEIWLRLIAAGGFGLLPVLALATVYDPAKSPAAQDFEGGISKLISTLMRLLLPLTLGVLLVYVVVVPFYFRAPFESRDLLIVYNLMLFGIIGLLLGATPLRGDDLAPALQTWLRRGIIAVAVLVALISLYALSATVFRMIDGGPTFNRLAVIGWNAINIGILIGLIVRQFRDGRERWIESLQDVFSGATNAYVAWTLLLLLVLPLLFLVIG